MIKVNLIAFARSISIDYRTQNLSILELIEEMRAPNYPATLLESKIIILFERDIEKDPENVDVIIEIKNNEKVIGEQPVTLTFGILKKRRLIVEISQIQIEAPGKLFFVVNIGGKEIANYSVDVVASAIEAVVQTT